MRNLMYSHPMEFADDVRRIVTETYRYCHPEDPLVTAAAKLQQEFEMLFAKINFQVKPRGHPHTCSRLECFEDSQQSILIFKYNFTSEGFANCF